MEPLGRCSRRRPSTRVKRPSLANLAALRPTDIVHVVPDVYFVNRKHHSYSDVNKGTSSAPLRSTKNKKNKNNFKRLEIYSRNIVAVGSSLCYEILIAVKCSVPLGRVQILRRRAIRRTYWRSTFTARVFCVRFFNFRKGFVAQRDRSDFHTRRYFPVGVTVSFPSTVCLTNYPKIARNRRRGMFVHFRPRTL